MRLLAGELLRFSGLGGLNTLLTGALLALLARWMDPHLAFTLAYGLGIVFATMTTARFVFSRRATTKQRILFAMWYVAVYVIGLAIVGFMSDRSADPTLLAVTTVFMTAPLGFLGGRLIFSTSPRYPPRTGGQT